MGIDLGDVLNGIGAGMSKLGELKDERRKEKLAQALEEKRNQDAENREIRREQRREVLEAKTVRSTRLKPVEGGMFMVEELNSFGELAKPPRPATPEEIAQHNREEKKGDLSITALETNIEADRANIRRANAETDYIPEKRSLERRYTEAQIRNLDEPNSTRKPTLEERALEGDDAARIEMLKDWGKDYIRQAQEQGGMTKLEAENWVRDVYLKAKELGVSPRKMLDDQARILAPAKEK